MNHVANQHKLITQSQVPVENLKASIQQDYMKIGKDSPPRSETAIGRSPSPYIPKNYQSLDFNSSFTTSNDLDKKYLRMREIDFYTNKEAENKNKVIFA